MKNTPTLTVFISSPGDVNEERILAGRVIQRLNEEFYGILELVPIFWEHEPMLMSETFQTQLPLPSKSDIFICILWSRIGTRLPSKICRTDGSCYNSGTQFEFAFEAKRNARFFIDFVDNQMIARIVDEYLLSHYPRLTRWITQNRNLLQLRAHLSDLATYWRNHHCHLIEFICQSVKAAQYRQQSQQIQQDKKISHLRQMTIALSILTLFALFSGYHFYTHKQITEQQHYLLQMKYNNLLQFLKESPDLKTFMQRAKHLISPPQQTDTP